MSMRSMLFICALKLLKRTAKLTRINGRPDKLNRSVKDRNFSTKVVQISCFFFFNLNDTSCLQSPLSVELIIAVGQKLRKAIK